MCTLAVWEDLGLSQGDLQVEEGPGRPFRQKVLETDDPEQMRAGDDVPDAVQALDGPLSPADVDGQVAANQPAAEVGTETAALRHVVEHKALATYGVDPRA